MFSVTVSQDQSTGVWSVTYQGTHRSFQCRYDATVYLLSILQSGPDREWQSIGGVQ